MTENYEDMTKDELYEKAQELDIDGRSTMDKDELVDAVSEASEETEATPEVVADPPAGVDPDAVEDQDASFADTPEKNQAGGFQPVADNSKTYDSSGGEFQPTPGPEAHNASEIKSRREEEDEQHARREAGNARVESLAAEAKRTPF